MFRLLAVLLSAALAPLAAARDLTLVSISSTPAREMRVFQPLADYLAKRLADSGVTRGHVVIVADIPGAARVMRELPDALAIDSPYAALAISESAGSRVALRRWKNGRSEYHSVFVVRSDSPLQSLAGLRGGSLAFESPWSSTGFFLPATELAARHIPLHEAHRPAAAKAGAVSYQFSGDAANSTAWVLHRRVDAATIGIHDYEAMKASDREQLRILHATAPIPRQLVSISARTDAELARRIADTLRAMEHDAEGRSVLAGLDHTARFDDLQPRDLRTLAELRAAVRAQVSR